MTPAYLGPQTRRSLFTIAVLLVASAEGCGKNANQQSADPVGSFKNIADKFQSGFDGFEAVFEQDKNLPSRCWCKFRPRVANIEYDVKTTDSMVTPYSGTLVCDNSGSESAGKFKTEDEARKASTFEKLGFATYKYRLTYGFQDGRWTLKTAEMSNALVGGNWREWGSDPLYDQILERIKTFTP